MVLGLDLFIFVIDLNVTEFHEVKNDFVELCLPIATCESAQT